MKESLSDNLALTVAETGGLELSAEILEFSIDQIIDNGILKDIPVVGWIVKGLSFTQSISDRILYHKILRFLFELEKINEADRQKFREKIQKEAGYRRKVGEHLLILINKIDAFDKVSLLAKCFEYHISGSIDLLYFIDLSHIIERSSLADLKALCVPKNQVVRFKSVGVAVACGILEFGLSEPDIDEELPQLGTRMSRFGRDLRDMFLGVYQAY